MKCKYCGETMTGKLFSSEYCENNCDRFGRNTKAVGDKEADQQNEAMVLNGAGTSVWLPFAALPPDISIDTTKVADPSTNTAVSSSPSAFSLALDLLEQLLKERRND